MSYPYTARHNRAEMYQGGFMLFRPWTQTDKRHTLKIASMPYESERILNQAKRLQSDPLAQRCRLEPVDLITLEAAQKSDKKRNKRVLDGDIPLTGLADADMTFVPVSWSSTSAQYLNVVGPRTMMKVNALAWALTLSEVPQAAEMKFYILTLLDPETTTLSL